jgi:hypothetical protein
MLLRDKPAIHSDYLIGSSIYVNDGFQQWMRSNNIVCILYAKYRLGTASLCVCLAQLLPLGDKLRYVHLRSAQPMRSLCGLDRCLRLEDWKKRTPTFYWNPAYRRRHREQSSIQNLYSTLSASILTKSSVRTMEVNELQPQERNSSNRHRTLRGQAPGGDYAPVVGTDDDRRASDVESEMIEFSSPYRRQKWTLGYKIRALLCGFLIL